MRTGNEIIYSRIFTRKIIITPTPSLSIKMFRIYHRASDCKFCVIDQRERTMLGINIYGADICSNWIIIENYKFLAK